MADEKKKKKKPVYPNQNSEKYVSYYLYNEFKSRVGSDCSKCIDMRKQ